MGVSTEVSFGRCHGKHENCFIEPDLCGYEKSKVSPAKLGEAFSGFFKSGLL